MWWLIGLGVVLCAGVVGVLLSSVNRKDDVTDSEKIAATIDIIEDNE